MMFESWMTREILISDGNYTIGYVDGKPAQWAGNTTALKDGDEFFLASEGTTFYVNVDPEFQVIDGKWVCLVD